MPRPPLPKIAWVYWKDATIQPNGNISAKDVIGPAPLLSCGVFVKETDEYISVAVDSDIEDNDSFRLVQSIPKVNIIDYKVLEIVADGSADLPLDSRYRNAM